MAKQIPDRFMKALVLWNHQDRSCFWCGSPITDLEKDMTIDHIHPLSRGGNHDDGNLVVSCFKCNQGFGNAGARDKIISLKQRVMNS